MGTPWREQHISCQLLSPVHPSLTSAQLAPGPGDTRGVRGRMFCSSLVWWKHHSFRPIPQVSPERNNETKMTCHVVINTMYIILKPLLHYAGNLLATWWQKMVAGDCHHIFTPIIFYWIKFVHCIFYIEDIVNKYLLTHLLPPVANGRQYVASKISASVKGALLYSYASF